MTDLPAEIEVWESYPTLHHIGTWATKRYPEEAVTYVRKADAKAAQALVVERVAEIALEFEQCAAPDAIRALADTDGMALVNALRAEAEAHKDHALRLLPLANRTIAAEADRDRLAAANAALEAQVARLLEPINFLRETIRQNIVVKDGPHTVVLPDGSTHSGPLADFMHELLPMIADILDRAALAAFRGDATDGEVG